MPDNNKTVGDHCAAGEHKPLFCSMCDVRERSICADLSPREMAMVEKTMARRTIPKARAILSEGEPNDNLYVVVRGSFRLSKVLDDGRRQITGFLFKGDFLGVRATDASAYTAEALEESIVCKFSHSFLDELAAMAPSVKDRLIARGQTEYHKAQDHIVLLGKKTADERVASFLELIAASTSKQPKGSDRIVELPMSRQDIADYLGLRQETLSRSLAALRKSGAIDEVSRREIVLKAG